MRMTRAAFDSAVAEHGNRVFTLAVYLLNHREEAEDVTQEVLVRLWQRGSEVDPGRIGAWPMVVERDGFDSSWVFGHGDKGGEVDGLLVVEFRGDELEIVRLDGSIDRLMAEAIAEEHSAAGRLARTSH